MSLENRTILLDFTIFDVWKDSVQGLEIQDFNKTFFALEPSFFEIFKNDFAGVIYMSVAFHSHITC